MMYFRFDQSLEEENQIKSLFLIKDKFYFMLALFRAGDGDSSIILYFFPLKFAKMRILFIIRIQLIKTALFSFYEDSRT